jgi:hypothetical protein
LEANGSRGGANKAKQTEERIFRALIFEVNARLAIGFCPQADDRVKRLLKAHTAITEKS